MLRSFLGRCAARNLLVLLALPLSGPTVAAAADATYAPEIILGARAGVGELRINDGERIGGETVEGSVTEHTIGAGGTVEYRAPFRVVVEFGAFVAGSADLFDSDDYRLAQYFGSVGYSIAVGQGLTLTPRVGRARWKLESDRLWFLGGDEDAPAVRGYQNYWEITALKRISETVELGVSHRESSYDFGRARSTVFTAMFRL